MALNCPKDEPMLTKWRSVRLSSLQDFIKWNLWFPLSSEASLCRSISLHLCPSVIVSISPLHIRHTHTNMSPPRYARHAYATQNDLRGPSFPGWNTPWGAQNLQPPTPPNRPPLYTPLCPEWVKKENCDVFNKKIQPVHGHHAFGIPPRFLMWGRQNQILALMRSMHWGCQISKCCSWLDQSEISRLPLTPAWLSSRYYIFRWFYTVDVDQTSTFSVTLAAEIKLLHTGW